MVLVLTVAVPLGLAIWLGLSIRDGLVSMEKRNDQMREALDTVEKFKLNGAVADEPQVKIPDQAIPLETYVSKAADKGGLKFKGSIDTRKATKNGFVTTTVVVALDDVTTDQLKSFLQDVEQGEKVVAVTHLDVKRDWRDKKKLDATLEISTYSNVEKAKTEGEGGGDSKPDEDKDKDKKGG